MEEKKQEGGGVIRPGVSGTTSGSGAGMTSATTSGMTSATSTPTNDKRAELLSIISLYERGEIFPRMRTWAVLVSLANELIKDEKRREEFFNLMRQGKYSEAKKLV